MSREETKPREDRYPLQVDVRVLNAQGDKAASVTIDISCGGVGLDGLIHFAAGTPVRVEFPDGTTRTGRTIWADAFNSGVLFDAALLLDELDQLMGRLRERPHFGTP